ncbi:Nn.00g106170.m01.CDS01 [Neocucurbitaria sp. VM-36]
MPLSKLGVFASLALAASAVLIPPTITAEDLGDDNALETLAINPFKRSVTLECPGCAFATQEGDALKWKNDVGSAFLIDFEVGPNEDTLYIDGVQIYPPSFNSFAQSFRVTQIDPNSENGLQLHVTGYHMHYDAAETVSEAGTELIPMTFQIAAVESTNVDPPELTINLLKDSEGRLMIASFRVAHSTDAAPADQEKECKEWPLLCKWKSIVADRIDRLKKPGKGCHKRPHGHGRPNPMEEDTIEGKPPHRFHPGKPHHRPHHRPHHMNHDGHRHHGAHRFHMFLRRAFFTILIPILIGIFAGTLTYLIGMALGCLIAITIAKFRGQGYQRIALEDDVEEPEVPAEKQEYAELPAYDDPPVYEEAPEKEVHEETK